MFRDAVAAFAESIAEVFYDQVITIKQPPTGAVDRGGHPTGDWSVVSGGADIPCSIEDLSGDELERAKKIEPMATILVRMAYRSWIDESMRGYANGRILEIRHVSDLVSANAVTELLCTRVEATE